jgi:hypothetical protein
MQDLIGAIATCAEATTRGNHKQRDAAYTRFGKYLNAMAASDGFPRSLYHIPTCLQSAWNLPGGGSDEVFPRHHAQSDRLPAQESRDV